MDRSTARGWRVIGVALLVAALGCAAPKPIGDVTIRNATRNDANIVLEIGGKAKRRFEATIPPGGEVVQQGWKADRTNEFSITAWGDGVWSPRDQMLSDLYGKHRLFDRSGRALPHEFELRLTEGRLRIHRVAPVELPGSTQP